MSKFSCESVFILIHAVVLSLSLNLHQLVWSPSGILLFLAPTLLYSYHGFTWHHLNECTIQLGNLQSLFIWWEIRAGDTCHSSSYIDAALSNHLTESRTRAQEHPAKAVAQHPWGATLGALDLIADVRFSGTLMWFCFFSLSLEPWCRYQDLFFYHHCYYFHRERGLFSTQRSEAVGVLFLLFHDVALLLCDEGHGSPSEAVAGDGCHSEGPGTRLNVNFLYSGRGATGVLPRGVTCTSSLTQKFTRTQSHACAGSPALRW